MMIKMINFDQYVMFNEFSAIQINKHLKAKMAPRGSLKPVIKLRKKYTQ